MRGTRGLWVGVALLALLLAAPAGAKKNKRFGIEGQVVSYDEANKVLQVKVLATEVGGRWASGNTVGGKAPSDIRRLKEYGFAVEPEGSVLRRTVIKAVTGGGLDTSGTKEGFKKALGAIPEDRPVVFSLEENAAAAVSAGAPKYKILMVQIQLTEEEIARLIEERSVEE